MWRGWFWGIICLYINIFCTVNSAVLKCYKKTTSHYMETSMEKASSILGTSFFDTDLPTIFYIFGYTEKENSDVDSIIQAFMDCKCRNVCLMDWSAEANSYLGPLVDPIIQPIGVQAIGVNYLVVCGLLEKVAIKVGDALIQMSNDGMNIGTFMCVGHSLGAQMCGAIGRRVQEKGKKIPRITTLDPASVCFEHPIEFLKPVGRDCAEFVYNIHTDPGKYGISKSTGHADVWVNYEYYQANKVQPNCKKETLPLTIKSICSHQRSWQLLVESLRYPKSLVASKANSSADWTSGNQENSTIYIGDLVDTDADGDYYLYTNTSPSYGMYTDGLNPDNCPRSGKKAEEDVENDVIDDKEYIEHFVKSEDPVLDL